MSSSASPAQGESRILNLRLRHRLVHHIVIGATTLVLIIICMRLFPKRDFISQLSVSTAYPALSLTAAAMLLGPLYVLWQRPHPVSFDLRRDLGIWAGITALIHTLVGLNVHLRGRMWLYFVDEHRRLRRDAFGFGNYTGAVAAVVFPLLLALSFSSETRSRAVEVSSAVGVCRISHHSSLCVGTLFLPNFVGMSHVSPTRQDWETCTHPAP